MPKKKTITSDQARFGWSSGELSYLDAAGNKIRIGEPDAETQLLIEKLKAERQPTRLLYPASRGRRYRRRRS